MTEIKIGPEGWSGLIAQEVTVDNFRRIGQAVAEWMNLQKFTSIVIGFDTRFAAKLFTESIARIFASHRIMVIVGKDFVTTGIVAKAVLELKADLGIMITGSHWPPSFSGLKLISNLGGPCTYEMVNEIEKRIPEKCILAPKLFEEYKKNGQIIEADLEVIYYNYVNKVFDIPFILGSGLHFVFDAMYGSSQFIFLKMFPTLIRFNAEYNPSFKEQAPEIKHENFGLLSLFLKNSPYSSIGIAFDGDASKIGLYEENGAMVDTNKTVMVLLYCILQREKQKGKIILAYEPNDQLKVLADHFGIEVQIVAPGFEYIKAITNQKNVLLGCSESGQISVKNHLLQSDAIWVALIVMESIVKKGKTFGSIYQEVEELMEPK